MRNGLNKEARRKLGCRGAADRSQVDRSVIPDQIACLRVGSEGRSRDGREPVPRQSKPQFYYIRGSHRQLHLRDRRYPSFGKNKTAVLKTVSAALGTVPLCGLTVEQINQYVDGRRASGAGDVKAGIDLTYDTKA